MKLNLNNIDLVAMDCLHPEETIKSLNISMCGIDFGHIFLFDANKSDYRDVDNIEFIRIPKIYSRNGYSDFCLRLTNYCNNDFLLYTQNHAFIINPECWDNKYLEYDYIGAPWTSKMIMSWNMINRVGNGAFSLRSKKFLDFSNQFSSCEGWNEDGYLTNFRLKDALSSFIKFPDADLAFKFSCESLEINQIFDPKNHFGFHGNDKLELVLKYLQNK